jgi:hypothetical protein
MSAAEATRQEWLKTRKLLAFMVLPGQIEDLTAFRDTWRQSTGERGEPDYAGFHLATAIFLRVSFHVQFWSDQLNEWRYEPYARGAVIRSPYARDWVGMGETDHSMGSPDGPNLWLDRFHRAKYDFVSAFVVVKGHAQMRRLREGAQEPVEEELVRAMNSLKSEFAALYALSRWDPATPIPDTSRTGRDTHSKWYTNGGTFGVWRDGLGRALLSDPEGLQAQLRGQLIDGGEYLRQLNTVGRLLTSMPGDFGDLEARIEEKLAGMRRRQRKAIAEGVAEGHELFRS